MNRILALDPGTTTGYFLYENWSNWQISSFTDKNWLNQAKNLQNLVKKEQVNILVCEVSSLWQKQNYNYHYGNLIKLVGHTEYLAQTNNIEYVPISNQFMGRWNQEAKDGNIKGLVYQIVPSSKGRPKQTWTFKKQPLNEHEKDAVLIFYVYWCKFQKKVWPFV